MESPRKFHVYLIFAPDPVYVGHSVDPDERLAWHSRVPSSAVYECLKAAKAGGIIPRVKTVESFDKRKEVLAAEAELTLFMRDVCGVPLTNKHHGHSQYTEAQRDAYAERETIRRAKAKAKEISKLLTYGVRDPEDRLIWELHCAGLSIREIAQGVKTPIATVHYRIKKLRDAGVARI